MLVISVSVIKPLPVVLLWYCCRAVRSSDLVPIGRRKALAVVQATNLCQHVRQ